jgi:hypothetical protein
MSSVVYGANGVVHKMSVKKLSAVRMENIL